MKRIITPILALVLIAVSCTVGKVSDKGQDGYFQATKKPKILINEPVDLDENKSLLVVPNQKFIKGMVENIGYFERIITVDELEKEIIKNNMQDQVGVLSGRIGMNSAYRKYKKFLYLTFADNKNETKRIQLKLINPENFDDLFVADTAYDVVWAGVNDQNTFNPLFNSLIEYIRTNSKTFK